MTVIRKYLESDVVSMGKLTKMQGLKVGAVFCQWFDETTKSYKKEWFNVEALVKYGEEK